MKDVLIRPATIEDAGAIAAIYNHYISTSTATFDTDPKTVAERTKWLAARDPQHPVLVAEDSGGCVVGWAALSPWSPRPAWGRTCETAVYLAPESCGGGLGSRMLESLIDAARQRGHHALVAQIVGENAPSLAMTQRAGFERVGVLREVGWKFDRWLDVVLLELVLEETK